MRRFRVLICDLSSKTDRKKYYMPRGDEKGAVIDRLTDGRYRVMNAKGTVLRESINIINGKLPNRDARIHALFHKEPEFWYSYQQRQEPRKGVVLPLLFGLLIIATCAVFFKSVHFLLLYNSV